MPSVLFASQHCYLEPASGAMASMRDLFFHLGKRGWKRQVVCGPILDTPGRELSATMREAGLTPRSAEGQCAGTKYSIHRVDLEGAAVLIYEPRRWAKPPLPEQAYPYLQLLDRVLSERRPDVMLTFGGHWIGRAQMAIARRHGVPAVFWLRNFKYRDPDLLKAATAIIVPSEFAAEDYARKLNVKCTAIAPPLRRERVLAEKRTRKNVTFVSPELPKGSLYFAAIAAELGKRRPDIPVLVAVGRGDMNSIARAGLHLRNLPNFRVMPPTDDPREIWGVTRVLLAPSLWPETFLRVAAEAMINGIPTLAARRGAIPQTLGQSGFLFDIPERFTATSLQLPRPEEIENWISTILRLFDDVQFYQEASNRCLSEAARFDPESLAARHEAALLETAKQGKPPMSKPGPLAGDLEIVQRFFASRVQFENLPEFYDGQCMDFIQ